MDPDQFYCYPTAGDNGMIYCAIQFEKTDIVIFDPEKKTKASLIARSDARRSVCARQGERWKNLFQTPTLDRWFRIENKEKLVEVPESEVPLPDRGLPDGRQFHLAADRTLRVEAPAGKEKKEFLLQYESLGLFHLRCQPGPDQRSMEAACFLFISFVYGPQDRFLADLERLRGLRERSTPWPPWLISSILVPTPRQTLDL